MLPSKIVKILISILFVLLAVLLLCRPLDQDNILFSGDIGFVFSVAEGIVNRLEVPLLGPSSHIGGRHLGAWYFYLVAFFYFLTMQSIILTVYCMIAVKVICLFIPLKLFCSKIFSKSNDYSGTIVAGVVLLFACCNQQFFPLRTPWHGADLVIGSGILMTGVYYWIFNGHTGVFLLSATLAFQLHFGFAPSVLGFLIWGALLRRHNNTNCSSLWVNKIVYFIAGILWLPFLIFLIKYPQASPFASLTSDHIKKSSELLKVFVSNYNILTSQVDIIGINRFISNWFGMFLIIPLILSLIIVRKINPHTFSLLAKIISIILLPFISTFSAALVLRQVLDPYIWYVCFASLMLLWAVFFIMPILLLWNSSRIKQTFLFVLIFISFSLAYSESKIVYPVQNDLFKTIPAVKATAQLVLEQSNLKNTPHSVKGRGSLAGSEGAIYFFLGKDFYPFHDASNRFVELNSFIRRQSKDANKIILTDQSQLDLKDLNPWIRRGWQVINQDSVAASIFDSNGVVINSAIYLNTFTLIK